MASFVDLVAEARACNDLSGLVDAIPYHRYLGIKVVELAPGITFDDVQNNTGTAILPPE